MGSPDARMILHSWLGESESAAYAQQEDYETGHIMGGVDYACGFVYPRTPWGIYADNTAAIQGYERGWLDAQDSDALDSPATDEEARFEDELTYHEAMWS